MLLYPWVSSIHWIDLQNEILLYIRAGTWIVDMNNLQVGEYPEVVGPMEADDINPSLSPLHAHSFGIFMKSHNLT